MLLASELFAQSITSRITGTVTDTSGAIVPAATVAARNVDTNERQETRSDNNGSYLLLNLKPGGYDLEVNAPGFKRYVQTGIRLQLEQESRLDIALQLGALSE